MTKSNDPRWPAAAYSTDSQRWAAVVGRDRQADGAFVYSVRTTGVYCRPSCPSRRPRRDNVAFHDSSGEAERAGFRPCKRCRPGGASPNEERAAAVARACQLIEAAEEAPSLATLAGAVGMSQYHFQRVFKSITGVSPKAYAAAYRAESVRRALETGHSVTDAIYEAGFGSSGRFYAKAAEMLGMKPGDFLRGGEGEVIRFAVGECDLGSILVAATTLGVCAISLGDEPELLVRDLQDRFPGADLVGGDEAFERLVATVVGSLDSPTPALELPLHVRGTAFQHRVWQALRQIPAGDSVSYSEIARRIGSPGAARAVAGACAANAHAVAIPCHRVVRADGGLAGYRWGVERKRELLAREGGRERTALRPIRGSTPGDH